MKHVKKLTPLDAIKQLEELSRTLQGLGIPTHTLNPVRANLQQWMESLPICFDGIADKFILGFILGTDGKNPCWYPVHAMEDITHGIFNGGVNYRIDYTGGSAESGPAQKYHWAHCTADDTVNYHWLDAVDEPVVDPCPQLNG